MTYFKEFLIENCIQFNDRIINLKNGNVTVTDFFQIIEACLAKKKIRSNLVNQLLSNRADINRFIIGKNDESIKLINLLKIDGIIDDFSGSNLKWEGIPVFRREDVPKDALVVNCSTSISPVTVGKKLAEAGLRNVMNIHEVIAASEGKIKKPWFVDEMQDDYRKHKSEWCDLYNLTVGEETRRTLLDVMRFRLSADPVYMMNYSVRPNEQYFEDFLMINHETFVDAGGFDGATTEMFCSKYPKYKKVFFFEPSHKNMKLAKKRLKDLRDIVFYSVGLSDTSGILSFDSDVGPASAIKITDSSSTIKVTTLDEIISEPVSFIKMDLEGWELNALKGSKNHIIKDTPKLAIAVYHGARDFRMIKDYILSLGVNYDIYLRHYTEGWSETIMYFVPK
jgi:FkbM family methyltransferase